MITSFTSVNGPISSLIEYLGGERVNLLMQSRYFRAIYVSTGIWQNIGWGSIIYLAALTGIDMELYEAATIDGAGRFRQFLNVTLPGIMPTIVIMLILQIGKMMTQGSEKVILLYSEATYDTADIISSYVYRKGIVEANYSFSTAVGLFNSVINLVLVVLSNTVSKKLNETSLW
jgi:putative aldouronate transport system permease protein